VTHQIHAGIEWLRQAKADHIVIPCNSVHEFVGDFRVLNIIDATLKLCPPGKIGVLCSKQTREAKLYEKFSREIVYYPNQNSIDDIISSILSGIPCDLSLMMNGSFPECDSIVIGCTDLSLCSWRRTNKYVVDSTQALAEATVREMVARVASA
jgi:aspartate/glutamate racemase